MPNSKIFSINGPVVKVRNTKEFSMMEMVYVGEKKIIGEVISVNDFETTIQVYETTNGLKPNEPVYSTKMPLFATLGPGIVSGIFDGILRPLKSMEEKSGCFIEVGSNIESLNLNKKFNVKIVAKVGEEIKPGQIFAECKETESITHKCMLSPFLEGGIVTKTAPDGEYSVNEDVLEFESKNGELIKVNLCQKWPIRKTRPVKERLKISKPLVTGQRIIDTMFPIAKGGTAAIPGGFGTGKTMTQHAIAKWCDADIIIYIGCGERGNEITQVLEEFSHLIDPRTKKALTERTVLIANTSNMPVAAREASIYTGITLAEYYRDMGYHIAIMADSTSRWAEALREISGRLEEMPAEEGFPSYLPSRLSQFYERAGYVKTLSGKEGSITIIGAVSPQGSDFSEPVTQNTKRFVRCFWALDKSLAYARHYPAINWMDSYSEYDEDLKNFFDKNLGEEFLQMKNKISAILAKEAELLEIVKLIGMDVLPDEEKLIIETAKIIRVLFLQQNAFNENDCFVTLKKQKRMMEVILHFYDASSKAVNNTISFSQLKESDVLNDIYNIKYETTNENLEKFDEYIEKIDSYFKENIKN